MKRIISTLALAAPLATVALSLGATPAMAEPAGPAIDQIKSAELGPVDPHVPPGPQGPQDKTQPNGDPDPDPGPDGPDDKVSIPQPCPTHGTCGKDPGDEDEKDAGDDDSSTDDFKKPNRIDAGAGTSDEGMELAWLLAGGGLVTVTGAAYAVRRRVRTEA